MLLIPGMKSRSVALLVHHLGQNSEDDTATGHKCFGQFHMYWFHFLPLGNSVHVQISHTLTFVTFVDATKKSSAELSALREFDAVNFL